MVSCGYYLLSGTDLVSICTLHCRILTNSALSLATLLLTYLKQFLDILSQQFHYILLKLWWYLHNNVMSYTQQFHLRLTKQTFNTLLTYSHKFLDIHRMIFMKITISLHTKCTHITSLTYTALPSKPLRILKAWDGHGLLYLIDCKVCLFVCFLSPSLGVSLVRL